MQISKEIFLKIAAQVGVSEEQSQRFWGQLESSEGHTKPGPFSVFLYYFGALIVISAMTWFMNLGWERFGGLGLFFIALLYGLIFATIGALIWKQHAFRIPAGLLITCATCMVPL